MGSRNLRAENGGLDASWLDFAFLGHPDLMKFQLKIEILGVFFFLFLVGVVSQRGPAMILFISRDACSDSIAKLFRACFHGVLHNYRAIRCRMGYRTGVPV